MVPAVAAALISGGIQGGTSLISGLMQYFAANKQLEAQRETNQQLLRQAAIERGIQQEQFGETMGLQREQLALSEAAQKADIKMGKRQQAFLEKKYTDEQKRQDAALKYDKMMNLANNIKTYFGENPAFRLRLQEVQGLRRAA